MEKEDLKLIINAIESGKCLAFLGAGACTDFENHKSEVVKGLPTGKQLAEILAQKCQYINGNAYDLLKVSEQYLYEHNGDRLELERVIRKEIQKGCAARPIHTVTGAGGGALRANKRLRRKKKGTFEFLIKI